MYKKDLIGENSFVGELSLPWQNLHKRLKMILFRDAFGTFKKSRSFRFLLLKIPRNLHYYYYYSKMQIYEGEGGGKEREREIENFSLCFLNQYRVGNCVKKVKNFKFLRHNSYNFLLFQVFHFLQPSFPSTHWIEDRANTTACKGPSSINTFNVVSKIWTWRYCP